MRIEQTFGKWLKQRRRQLDLTQVELAQQVGCSVATIRKIEQDARRPSKQLADLMADALLIPAAQQAAFITFARTEAYMAPMPDMLTVLEETAAEPPSLPEMQTAAVADASSPPHNLSSKATPFVGREVELENLKQRIATNQNRLITIVGVGGMGKTRLALAVAEQLLPTGRFIDGIFFINLAPLSEAQHIVPALAEAVDYPLVGDGQTSQKQLLGYLHQKKMLLIFDNFEHLLDGIDLLTDILRTAPHIQILVTSRERLRLHSEQLYPIEGLTFPEWQSSKDVETFTAVQLFLQSARHIQPDFTLQDNDLLYLAHICRMVEGMPLAIELAASWVDMLSLAAIATELQQGLDILETELRDIPSRHRSIRAAIDYSWHKLAEEERKTFIRLSVFRGGFTREAAQIVAKANLRQLSQLANKSLLQFDRVNGRYYIHEQLRQYGSEKLIEFGQTEAVRNHHLAYFLRLAEEAEPHLESSEQMIWLNRLGMEHDNLRTALTWSLEAKGALESGMRLAGALSFFWQLRDYSSEGRAYFSKLLSSPKAAHQTAMQAKILYEAGRLAFVQSDYSAADALLEESISLYRNLGSAHQLALAHALITLGDNKTSVGDYSTALSVLEAGLSIMRASNDANGTARALWKLGWCEGRQGNFDRANRCFTEAMSLYRQTENKDGLSTVLQALGELALRQHNNGLAIALLEKSLALSRELGHTLGVAALLGTLAWAALQEGDLKQSVIQLAESIRIRRKLNDIGGIAWCLEKLAEITLIMGKRESCPQQKQHFLLAAQLFGEAEALRAPIGSVIDLIDQPVYKRQVTLLKNQLGDATFAAAWSQGENLDVEQTIESLLAKLA